MYAVIFRAEIGAIDEVYAQMASQLRQLAETSYGCTEFISVTEGTTEIAISYWDNEEQIERWRQDSEHLVAQKLGRSTWYRNYQVQIVKIIREYTHTRQ